MRLFLLLSAVIIAVLWLTTNKNTTPTSNGEVNIYYSGKEYLIRPLLDDFTKEAGIQTNLITGDKAGLITRIEQEGEHSPADVLMTVDIGNIYKAKEKGLLQPITSEALETTIPSHLRGVDNDWFGVSLRARALVYAKDRVNVDRLSDYAALTAEEWKGRLLVRSSNNVYNQSLLASIIAHQGEQDALEWAQGMVSNFARTPKGGDTDQIRAVAAGEGDIAIVNHYYYARLLNTENAADKKLTDNLSIFFPNQGNRGTHINIRGGGVTTHAKNTENAIAFLEYMVSENGQRIIAQTNYEFPVRAGTALPETLERWRGMLFDTLPLTKVGANNAQAVMLFDKAGWQ